MLQNRVPNVRFIEYSDEWAKTKLNRITEIIGGGTPDTKQSSYWNGGINWFSPTEVGKTVYLTNSEKTISQLGLQKSSARLLPAFKTILFTSRAGIGDVGILTEDSATNQGFQSLVVNEETDVYFLFSYSDRIKKYALKHSAGSTFLEISGKELGKMDLSIPSLPEQKAIGSLFLTLDDLLASYKDNLANYQSLKATMLSKIFPKAGQTVPEIRLDGFEGEWRIMKLGDVLSELKSGLSRELSNDDIGLPVIRANNISDGNLNLDRDIKYWFKVDPKGANTANYFVKENDILVNFINSEAKMGTAAIVSREPDRETIYTTNILKLTVKEGYYPYFIYLMTLVQSYQNYIKSITKPAVNQASFTTVDFKKYEFLCPAFQEQQAIGAYFSNLDNLIVAHQEKISRLETLKKKLLQDMFI